MLLFLVLHDYAYSALEKLNAVLNPVLDSKLRLKILMKWHSCNAPKCEIFWDNAISLSPLGALECVVRVLMHFYFWNIEGTLVPVDHCGFKVMFLFNVFIRSKHLTVLSQVMHFSGTPNNYWCEDVAQLWGSLKSVPQNCKGLSALGGLWHSELTLQITCHCILSHKQAFHPALGFQCN